MFQFFNDMHEINRFVYVAYNYNIINIYINRNKNENNKHKFLFYFILFKVYYAKIIYGFILKFSPHLKDET